MSSSTAFGSIALAPILHAAPTPAYKISKTAMNALTVQYALDHQKDGFTFIVIAPGVRSAFPYPFSILHLCS